MQQHAISLWNTLDPHPRGHSPGISRNLSETQRRGRFPYYLANPSVLCCYLVGVQAIALQKLRHANSNIVGSCNRFPHQSDSSTKEILSSIPIYLQSHLA
jgi:hypothetical protein